MRKRVLILYVFALHFVSCIPHDDTGLGDSFLRENGLFLVCEGNFMWGNGSISYYSFDSLEIHNDIFYRINGRTPGDVPYFLGVMEDRIYIVINNSNKIEVADRNTFRSAAVITGLVSPRQIVFAGQGKAYVSSLYSTKIAIVDLYASVITGYIETGRTTEAMLPLGEKVYVTSWAGGNEIIVLDTGSDEVCGVVTVGNEPESLVSDCHGRLWVLCSGGYSGEYFPEINVIDTASLTVSKVFRFGSSQMSPFSLTINNGGDTVYYIERSVWRMSVNDTELPAEPFIRASGRNFFKIAADHRGGRLFATNALDYQQKGYILAADSRGNITDSARVGIIPGYMHISYKKNR